MLNVGPRIRIREVNMSGKFDFIHFKRGAEDFRRAYQYFDKVILASTDMSFFDMYGKMGVSRLKDATPVDSGETANSWHYKIVKTKKGDSLEFYNSNIVDGCVVAILIQYGHATINGGYVPGREYINTAIQPVLDQLNNSRWRGITGV